MIQNRFLIQSFLFMMFSLTLSIPALYSQKTTRSLITRLPVRPQQIDGYQVSTAQAMSDCREALLSKDSVVQLSQDWSKHNLLKADSLKMLKSGTKVALVFGEPWILRKGNEWKGWFFCRTPAGAGFIPAESLLFRPYRDSTTLAGIQLVPKLFDELHRVQLEYRFLCITGGNRFSLPIHHIDDGYEIKLITDSISIRDADKDGRADFVLSGTLFQFTPNRVNGTLSKAEGWIGFRNRQLTWLYTYETAMIYPADQGYRFKYLKSREKESRRLVRIEKIVTQKMVEEESVLLYSSADLMRIPEQAQGPVEKKIHFPASATVTEDNLRLRAGPGLNHGVITLLQKGSSLSVSNLSEEKEQIGGEKSFWLKVKTTGGKSGWVYGRYVKLIQGNG